MSTSKHLHIINPSYNSSEDVSFTLFSALSMELRLRVWQCSIQQNRLLEIELDRPQLWAPEPTLPDAPYSATNGLNKVISGRNYTIRGCKILSKLLHVNRESRDVALRFYRVHMPCYFPTSEGGTPGTAKSTLYVNPEYDFMFLRIKQPPENTFVDFVNDFKAHDPKAVGLLNLALDANSMTALQCSTDITVTPGKPAFLDSLQQLREIIWVAESMAGRSILGPLDDFEGAGIRFNNSMPLKASTPTFQYVLTAGVDPRQLRVQWRQLLAKWGIQQAQETRERFLFASQVPRPEQQQIHDMKTASKYLDEEEERWLKVQRKYHRIVKKCAGKVPVEGSEELAKAVRPAIGFWLFPPEALGRLEGFPEEGSSRTKKVFDMTDHWPELALSFLF
ncbi:hypothetical protein LSUE1_G000822 [Lachnellula suecica]|uniref:2EXR domain-containing protein n=1 Tax=Lachnellula suecica TaxID=602035 RepID=A0A8T9CHR8_9HELO|nr:hypothetical protein LSUE1_G000822 [Lachnellula suecica]